MTYGSPNYELLPDCFGSRIEPFFLVGHSRLNFVADSIAVFVLDLQAWTGHAVANYRDWKPPETTGNKPKPPRRSKQMDAW